MPCQKHHFTWRPNGQNRTGLTVTYLHKMIPEERRRLNFIRLYNHTYEIMVRPMALTWDDLVDLADLADLDVTTSAPPEDRPLDPGGE